MKLTTVYEDNRKAYILINDKCAEEFAQEFIDKFMEKQDKNVIFVIYHVKDNVILLHFKVLDNEKTDFNKAINLVKTDILSGKLCADDENLKIALNDPQATTAKFLLKLIEVEECN